MKSDLLIQIRLTFIYFSYKLCIFYSYPRTNEQGYTVSLNRKDTNWIHHRNRFVEGPDTISVYFVRWLYEMDHSSINRLSNVFSVPIRKKKTCSSNEFPRGYSRPCLSLSASISGHWRVGRGENKRLRGTRWSRDAVRSRGAYTRITATDVRGVQRTYYLPIACIARINHRKRSGIIFSSQEHPRVVLFSSCVHLGKCIESARCRTKFYPANNSPLVFFLHRLWLHLFRFLSFSFCYFFCNCNSKHVFFLTTSTGVILRKSCDWFINDRYVIIWNLYVFFYK